jgi:hypothetical protein
MWVMFPGGNGLPDPSTRSTFLAPAANPVDVQVGPDGNIYYADFDGGRIQRIQYFAANQPPVAVATASPTNGPAPLTVAFDGSGSSDPENQPLSYSWDLDDNGTFGDSTAVSPTRTYTQPGTYTVRLRVTDVQGASSTSAPITITANNTPPSATIATPTAGTTWKVGDTISFSGSATDPQQGSLPASALSWTLALQHCPSTCHEHTIQSWNGVASSSFTAPDHEYPSYLELRLTATDSGGFSDTKTLRLDPNTVTLTFRALPAACSSRSAAPAPRRRSRARSSRDRRTASARRRRRHSARRTTNGSPGRTAALRPTTSSQAPPPPTPPPTRRPPRAAPTLPSPRAAR